MSNLFVSALFVLSNSHFVGCRLHARADSVLRRLSTAETAVFVAIKHNSRASHGFGGHAPADLPRLTAC